MSATQALARAGLIVTVAFLVSRILGYVRVVVIGTTFGITGELDTFFAAFRIPDLIFQLVAAGALSSALIPIVSGLLATGEEARAWRVVSTVTNLVLAALLVLAVAVFVAAPAIVPVITPGFDGAQLDKTIELTRIMLLAPIFLALGAIATSALNARGRFAASAAAPIVYNLGIIAGAIVLAPSMGVGGLAVGVVLGSLGHLLVQVRPLARVGFRYRLAIELDEPLARRALVLMAPRALGMGASQITFVAMTAFASTLAPGSVSAFNIAMTLLQIPLGVIGVPLGIVILPTLSRELATGTVGRYLGLIARALGLLAFVMLPIAALGMVLRRDIVTLLFGYGEFTSEAVLLTADTLLVFLIGLAAHALIAVLARAFYAAQDTVTPVAAAIIAVIVNVSVGALTVGALGLQGLALAIALGAWIEAGILLAFLKRRYPAVELAGLGRTFAQAALGSALAAGLALTVLAGADAVAGADPGVPVILVRAVLAALVGAVGYLAMSSVLRVPELPALISVVTELVRRPGRA